MAWEHVKLLALQGVLMGKAIYRSCVLKPMLLKLPQKSHSMKHSTSSKRSPYANNYEKGMHGIVPFWLFKRPNVFGSWMG